MGLEGLGSKYLNLNTGPAFASRRTNDSSPSVCSPIRRLKQNPLGAMAWLPITGTVLSLCHISPARAFPSFILSSFALKLFQVQTKTRRLNSPAALNSLPFIQHDHNEAAPCQIPPLQSQPQACVALTSQTASPRLSLRTLTSAPQEPL